MKERYVVCPHCGKQITVRIYGDGEIEVGNGA